MPPRTISRGTETEQKYKEEKKWEGKREEGANQKAAKDQGAFVRIACDFASKILSLVDIRGKLKPTKDEKKVAKCICSTTRDNTFECSGIHALQCSSRSSAFTDLEGRGWVMEDIAIT